MVETGAYIMKIDPVTVATDMNSSIDQVTNIVAQKTKEITQKSIDTEISKIKNELQEQIDPQKNIQKEN